MWLVGPAPHFNSFVFHQEAMLHSDAPKGCATGAFSYARITNHELHSLGRCPLGLLGIEKAALNSVSLAHPNTMDSPAKHLHALRMLQNRNLPYKRNI